MVEPTQPFRIAADIPASDSKSKVSGAIDRYALKRLLRVGQTWEFEAISTIQQNNVVTLPNGATKEFERDTMQHRKGTVEVLAVKEGDLAAIRVHFDHECTDTSTENAQRIQAVFSLAGQTVTSRFDDKGNVVHDREVEPAAANELTRMLQPSNTLCPAEPVAIGDVWKIDLPKVARQFDLGPRDKVNLSCRFVKIDAAGDRRTANLEVKGTVEKNAGGVIVNMMLDGMARLDLISGESLEDETIAFLSTHGASTQQGEGGQPVVVNVTGGGKLTVAGRRRIVADGADVSTAAP